MTLIKPNKYPTEIHKGCCKNCPANHFNKNGIVDFEAEDIRKDYTKEEIEKDFLFKCAWRTDKLCKGNADYYGITQDFINSL